MRKENDVASCVFGAFNLSDLWKWIGRLALRFFFPDAPILVWLPVEGRPTVEFNWSSIVTHEIPDDS